MRPIYWGSLFIILFVSMVYAETHNAVTYDGRAVILKSDGTWKYDSGEGKTLKFLSYTTEEVAGEYSRNYLNFTIEVKNTTDRHITGWRIWLDVQNKFGDMVSSMTLTNGNASLGPGETETATFTWEDNEFMDDDVYSKLTGYSKENLIVKHVKDQVIFREEEKAPE